MKKKPSIISIVTTIATTITLFLFGTASFASMQIFPDVGDDELYKTGIEFLYSEGIINGYPDGTYQPQRTLNRAEMLKIIAEGIATLENLPANTFDSYAAQNCFDDVAANQWYTKYVCYAKDHDWVVGYEGGKYFKPEQIVTFVEGLKMAYKGFGLTYTESSQPWYRDTVEAASRENYIPFDVVSFSGGLKRGQMADLAARMIKGGIGEETLTQYLGDRINRVVTYETIEEGIDVSEMEIEVEEPGEEDDGNDGGATACTEEAKICWDGSSVGREFPACEFEACPAQTHTINMTNNGFEPSTLTVTAGDTVRFVNTGSTLKWPASNNHPTHTVYPGSSVSKCGGDEVIFDACHNLETDEVFEFTFNEPGTWGYHDHIGTASGSIAVSQ